MVWAAKIFGEQNLGSNFCEKKYGEQKRLAANFWKEIFGEQILLDKNFGSKIGNKFFLKDIFLGGFFFFFLGGGGGGMFWMSRLFWGETFASKIFWRIFASKMSFGGRKEYWVAKMFWRGKIWGAKISESNFLSLMVSP